MHESVKRWGHQILTPAHIEGKMILEVGSLDVNGSLRQHVMLHRPKLYIGTDMQDGPGVDVQIDAVDLLHIFQSAAFDVIICTEMLEHAERWFECLWTMTRILKDNGYLLLTTRSPGFPRHGYPNDYWRYTFEGLATTLMDMGYQILKESCEDPDPRSPGVFFWVRLVNYTTRPAQHYEPEKVI